MSYLWQEKDWPNLYWDEKLLSSLLAEVRNKQGRLLGRMEGLGFSLREDAVFRTLTSEIIKTSEIEGEILDVEQVRSSLARRLGLDADTLTHPEPGVEGIVEIVLDATTDFDLPLTKKRLFGWHATLFPTGYSGMSKISAGKWRRGPMQVVSGPVGMEKVHFIAPPAGQVPAEMDAFLSWFNSPSGEDPVLKAALSHLRFVTIHPFDDGNGRTARAIAEMALARSEGTAQRFYSMSAQIMRERKSYYEELERTQKHGADVTKWLEWFLCCLRRAIEGSEKTLSTVLYKARFWEKHTKTPFNDRQIKILNLFLDENFKGKLTSSKWATITKCSQDTAQRDINALIELGILKKSAGGGRSTNYKMEFS